MTFRSALTFLFAICVFFGFAPILSMLTATALASAGGCLLDEGGMHPCIILGTDWGETLNFMFVAAWFFFLTFPFAIIGLMGLTVLRILHLVHAARR